MTGWTSRTLSPLAEPWPDSGRWTAEWMTIGDETWYARISPTGDPDLPPIVMVHGLVVSGAYFRPVAAELDRRYRILVPDLPGYGRSRSRRMWTVPSITTRLAAWMDAHELRDVVLVANSLGCQIATLLAIDRPDLMRGMVLVAPTLDPAIRSAIQVMWRGAIDIPREQQTLWRIWIPDLFRAGPRRSLVMLQEMMREGAEQPGRLPEVRKPALVIGGDRDPIAPPEWVAAMARRMPDARSIVLPGCSHAMNYSDPRSLARAIDTVIDRRVREESGAE